MEAILAGDALLTKAFELVSNDDLIEDNVKVKVLQRLSKASGHIGMVGGQTLDMQSENQTVDLKTLESIHKSKDRCSSYFCSNGCCRYCTSRSEDVSQSK